MITTLFFIVWLFLLLSLIKVIFTYVWRTSFTIPLLRAVHISPHDRIMLSTDELKLLRQHELAHARQGVWAFGTLEVKLAEFTAERQAFREMLRQGYTLDDLGRLRLDMMYKHKFGLSWQDFCNIMRRRRT